MYKVIWMDVDGTLLDFDQAEQVGFEQVLKHYQLPLDAGLQQLYHQINQSCWQAFEAGTMSRQEVLIGRFDRFFHTLGMKVDGCRAEALYRDQLESQVFLIDGALEICAWLKQHSKLYILTNGVSATQYKRLGAAGLMPYFEDIFVSEDTGSQKPQKAYFDYCFQRTIAVKPEEILMVGDSLTSDMQGGYLAGVDTCWYNPDGKPNETGVPTNYEIRSLWELKGI